MKSSLCLTGSFVVALSLFACGEDESSKGSQGNPGGQEAVLPGGGGAGGAADGGNTSGGNTNGGSTNGGKGGKASGGSAGDGGGGSDAESPVPEAGTPDASDEDETDAQTTPEDDGGKPIVDGELWSRCAGDDDCKSGLVCYRSGGNPTADHPGMCTKECDNDSESCEAQVGAANSICLVKYCTLICRTLACPGELSCQSDSCHYD